jgi:hypothetical protein
MSRSRRKTAIIGMTTAPSDKPFKVDEHRAERHAVRAVVKRSIDSDDRALHSKVYGDPWKSPKDDKQMVDPNSKWNTNQDKSALPIQTRKFFYHEISDLLGGLTPTLAAKLPAPS